MSFKGAKKTTILITSLKRIYYKILLFVMVWHFTSKCKEHRFLIFCLITSKQKKKLNSRASHNAHKTIAWCIFPFAPNGCSTWSVGPRTNHKTTRATTPPQNPAPYQRTPITQTASTGTTPCCTNGWHAQRHVYIAYYLFFSFLNLSVEGILKCNLKHLRHVFKYSNVKRSIQSANASNSPLQSVMQNGISKPYTLGTKQNLLNLKRVLKLIFKKSNTNRPALGNKWFK